MRPARSGRETRSVNSWPRVEASVDGRRRRHRRDPVVTLGEEPERECRRAVVACGSDWDALGRLESLRRHITATVPPGEARDAIYRRLGVGGLMEHARGLRDLTNAVDWYAGAVKDGVPLERASAWALNHH